MSHKAPKPFYPLNIAILTVSDTRTLAEDTSGQYLEDAVRAAGHHLAARTLRQLKTDNEIATLDALIADLRTQHATPGYGADPNVSAPNVVADVARELSLSENAARYYLQLLALAHPTDKNIRLWNSWKKKDITAAASELLANNLIIEAKRTRAGRSYFLPGAWLEGVSGSAPIEQWKTPYYLYWKDSKARPVIAGSPMIMPYRQLFTDAWERYRRGDSPGYADLDTAQYRKPPRRR